MRFPFSARFLTGGLAAFALASVTAAQANPIKFLNASGSVNVTVSYYNGTGIVSENTSAGQYNISLDGGATSFGAYCTDLQDNIHDGETWTSTTTQTQNPVNGLGTLVYAGGVHNVGAIDYIAQNFLAPPSQPAAQLAIWDLVNGGHVTKTGSAYAFDATKFSESGYVDLKSIYDIEAAALTSQTAGTNWHSVFERAPGAPGASGRPQDLVYNNPHPNSPIPEPAFYQMGVLLSGGGLMALRLRRKNG